MNKNKKVFVFDDNADILDLCTIILEDAGYDIKTSSTSNNIVDQVMAYTLTLFLWITGCRTWVELMQREHSKDTAR